MSRASTASGKTPTPSAWARGPPQNSNSSTAPSPPSQSPAPSHAPSPIIASHSRRPSALGQGVPIKEGVSVPRNNVGSVKQGSSVNFGSINDVPAPVPSSPAATPVVKTESVKSFGSVPVTTSSHVNGKTPASTSTTGSSKLPARPASSTSTTPATTAPTSFSPARPAIGKADIAKLFQGSSSAPSQPAALTTAARAAFAARCTSIPTTLHPGHATAAGYWRPTLSGLLSLRAQSAQAPNLERWQAQVDPVALQFLLVRDLLLIPPIPIQPPPAGVPPQQVPMQPMPWNGYYYDSYGQPTPSWFYSMHQPHHPHASHPPAPVPPHSALRQYQCHILLSLLHPRLQQALVSVTLNTNASAFVPTRPAKVVIKNEEGMEVNLESLKKHIAELHLSGLRARRRSRRREEQARREQEMKEAEVRTRREEEEERKRREEEETKRKEKEEANRREEEEVKRRAEEEAKRREEEAKRKEEEEAKRKEEQEAKRKEEEEKERLRKEEEEKERLRLEEERKREEDARLEEERMKAQEEKERAEREAQELQQKEDLEREEAQLEAEETHATIESPVEESREPEEGEVIENGEEIEEPHVNGHSVSKPTKALKEALRIDTSSMPPPLEIPRRRPGPLDINAAKRDISTAPLSALATAKNIERLQDVEYPEGVMSPCEDLNQGRKRRQVQFMQICKEKPPNLPPLDVLGIEPVDQTSFNMTRGGSGRHRHASSTMPPSATRQSAVGLGISQFVGKPGLPSAFAMGQFATMGASKLSSEDRFNLSTAGTRSASVGGGPAGMQFRPPPPMSRTNSHGGPGGPMATKRTRSRRGGERSDANKVGLEPVAPLEVSANRWVAASTTRKPGGGSDTDSPELVDRKVKALLNKLTMERFDSISDQIISWANKSENETDGRTLIQVIRLVFEKATDEAAWSEMYARLCRKMMETISPEVQDDGIKNAEGKPIAGGQLFRKYLLNRCQEDFERGWITKEATAAAAAAKASDDQAIKAANEKMGEKGEESELYSEEYYAAQKAKRQGLGLIKFIGELFKLQMLTERIMHECVKKLLGNVENPEEEEIESLCQLLKTVGQLLDVPKARAHLDVYFGRMKELGKSPNVSSRMQFMLQDVIELRDRRWVARGAVSAPTTIAAVHEAAAKEKAAAEAQNYQRQISMSRGGSRRGGDRNAESGPDGWTTAGGSVPRPPPKAGDLSQFGKITKAAPMVMGPSSVFAGKKDNKRDSLSRTNSSSNMFSMLSQNPELAADAAAKASRPPSRKPSADFGQGGLPEPPGQRRKLQLLPRTRPTAAEETPPPASEEEPEAPVQMSEADAKKKVDEDVKEFFAVRNLEEADVYFTNLTEEHRFLLVDKLVASALESKEADALLVGEFFAQAASKGQCSPDMFEAGFLPMAEFLDDIAIDAPNAFKFMAVMLKGAGFDKDEERLGRIAGKSMDSDKLLQLVLS
ncbi:hypothetical protein BU15DRAFT_72432 [Melanogaster broomeanus]|nr:hypothetical protein BU15DRAFT_72432 [Melanogaster broomeanus]